MIEAGLWKTRAQRLKCAYQPHYRRNRLVADPNRCMSVTPPRASICFLIFITSLFTIDTPKIRCTIIAHFADKLKISSKFAIMDKGIEPNDKDVSHEKNTI